jgi:REP element-mobilizing transposase RayT
LGGRYDPDEHHRRSIRLKDWDYGSPGPYFVTICTHEKQNLFDDPGYRDIAENTWRNIPGQPHARQAILDEWVVMPNHLHAIILLNGPADKPSQTVPDKNPSATTLGTIVGNYKSLVTRRINNVRRMRGEKSVATGLL